MCQKTLDVLPVSGFVTGIIKDRSAKVFRASKAEASSTKREVGTGIDALITVVLHIGKQVKT